MVELLGPFAEIILWIGTATTVLGTIVLIGSAFVAIRDAVIIKIKKYRDRHKFEKPPIADCYCIGCHLWLADDKERTMGRCEAWDGYHTSADEFCARGFARNDDGYRNEKWRLEDS